MAALLDTMSLPITTALIAAVSAPLRSMMEHEAVLLACENFSDTEIAARLLADLEGFEG